MFDKLKPWKWFQKPDGTTELGMQIAGHQVINEVKQPASEAEMQRRIGVDSLLMTDKYVANMLISLAFQEEKDKEGTVIGQSVDMDGASLLIINSHLTRTSYITEKDAKILTWRVKRILNRIKMNLPETSIDLGIANFLGGLEIYFMCLIADAIEGRRVRAIKTIPKLIETTVRTEKGK